jgi:hypothetical protein
MTMEECKRNHLPHQFNIKYYDAIEVFQGKCVINAPIHVWDLQVNRDANYIAPILDVNISNSLSFMQKLTVEPQPTSQQCIAQQIRENFVNLDKFINSFQP